MFRFWLIPGCSGACSAVECLWLLCTGPCNGAVSMGYLLQLIKDPMWWRWKLEHVWKFQNQRTTPLIMAMTHLLLSMGYNPVPLHPRLSTGNCSGINQSSFMGLNNIATLTFPRKRYKKGQTQLAPPFSTQSELSLLESAWHVHPSRETEDFSRCRGFFMGILTSYLLYTLASWCSCCSSSPWKNGGNMVEIIGFVRSIAILHISSCAFTGICGWNHHKSS